MINEKGNYEYLNDLTESPKDSERIDLLNRELSKQYVDFKKLREKKINWKLAAAGFGAILSAGILFYSIYYNFYKNPIEPAEVQQIEKIETHNQPFIQSELTNKLNDDNRLK